MAYNKPRGSVKTNKVSDKHNLGRMPKEKVGHPFTGVNKFAQVSRARGDDDTTEKPFRPDTLYHPHKVLGPKRLPGETTLEEELSFLSIVGKPSLKEAEEARRDSVKRAGADNRKKRLEKAKGLKKGGRAGKGKMKTQGINRSKRTGFSGRGSGAALRGF